MSNIIFEDAPTAITSSAALGAATSPLARAAVMTAWGTWLPGKPADWPARQLVAAADHELTMSLVEDNKLGVPYTACRNLIRAFSETTGLDRRVRAHMEIASPRLKAFASEVVAVAATIRIARTQGLVFIGTRDDVNSYFGSKVWRLRWPGFGPDYLFCDLVGNATFVETKGEVFTERSRPGKGRLKGFAAKKVQTINARLSLPPGLPTPASVRYVLSRVRRGRSRAICVQWFNATQGGGDGERRCDALVLAVALSNYHQILRSLFGTKKVELIVSESSLGYPDYATVGAVNGRGARHEPPVFVPVDVARMFEKLEEWFRRLRESKQGKQGALQIRQQVRESLELNELLQQTLGEPRDHSAQQLAQAVNLMLDRLPMGIVAGAPLRTD